MRNPEADRQLYRNARREGGTVIIVWALAFLWTVGVSYVMGYEHGPASLIVEFGLADPGPPQPGLVLGFPDWVFWGIMLPWLLVSAFTVWFGLKGIADDDLGAEAAEEPHGEGPSHGH